MRGSKYFTVPSGPTISLRSIILSIIPERMLWLSSLRSVAKMGMPD